ncbi:hypothetical protein SHIRM173S_01089 [Streptomyces hirsutus]
MQLRYFNQTGWTAIFNGTETEIGRMVRVEGWDPATGTALVVDPQRGALRQVADYVDFSTWSGPIRSLPRYPVGDGGHTGRMKGRVDHLSRSRCWPG